MKNKPMGYWTYERCKEEALRYNNNADFKKYSSTAYHKINKKGWFELKQHIIPKIKPSGYWTYERCKVEALKYNTNYEFSKNSPTAYRKINNNNWLELKSHIEIIGDKFKRMIYVYEFEDNYAYIGLTCNIHRRNNEHISIDGNSSVYKHIQKNNIYPKLIKISDYIDVEEAMKLEGKTLEKYKNNKWVILNKSKTGSIGGSGMLLRWTKENVSKECDKYQTYDELRKYSPGAYNSIYKNGWLSEFYPNSRKRCKNGHWSNIDNCKIEASKYKSRSEFKKYSNTAYKYACKNDWMDEFYPK